nr:hypothetical protein [Actinopolyspora mzabensis]
MSELPDKPLHFLIGEVELAPFFEATTDAYHAYFCRQEPRIVFDSVDSGVRNRQGPARLGPGRLAGGQGRVTGWRSELEGAGIDPPDVLRGAWSPASGHVNGQLLAKRSDVGAVFVANDQMALGCFTPFTNAVCAYRRTCWWPDSTTVPTPPISPRR